VAIDTAASGEPADGAATAAADSQSGVTCAGNANATLQTELGVNAGNFIFDVSMSWWSGSIKRARIGFNPYLNGFVKLTTQASGSCSFQRTVLARDLPTIKFTIGPVPVWITQRLDVEVSGTAEVHGSYTSTAALSASAFVGVKYEDDKWSTETDIDIRPSFTGSSDAGASLNLALPTVHYRAAAYGVVGIDGLATARFIATFNPSASKYLVVTAQLDLAVGVSVTLDLKVVKWNKSHTFSPWTAWGPIEIWSQSGVPPPTIPTSTSSPVTQPPDPQPAGSYTYLDSGCGIRSDGIVVAPAYPAYRGCDLPGTFIKIVGGAGCGLRTDLTAFCRDGLTAPAGQLKDIAVAGFGIYSVEASSVCGLRLDDTIACSGGPLGDGRIQGHEPWPFPALVSPPSGTFKSLDGGARHYCAVRTDDSLTCWGAWDPTSPEGDLGPVTPPAGTFTSVDAGGYSDCAIRTNGTVACWGLQVVGSGYVQVALPEPTGIFTSVISNPSRCGIRPNGTAECWYGSTTWPSGTFVQLDTCWLRSDTTVACWPASSGHRY